MRKDQCFECKRRVCRFRIYTQEKDFDEIACPDHVNALCARADSALEEGRIRSLIFSSSRLKRGGDYED